MKPFRTINTQNISVQDPAVISRHSQLGKGDPSFNHDAAYTIVQNEIRDAIDSICLDYHRVWVVWTHGIIFEWS